MPIASLNPFAMNYEIHPNMVPVDTVFMHGNLASNRWWEPGLEVWKKKANPANKGSLIFAEWRGCGKSAHPNVQEELHTSIMASDYVSLLKVLGISKANIVAHSTGGLIAMYAMLQAPELFNRCVFIDPVSAQGQQFGQEMFDAMLAMSTNREMGEAILGSTIRGNDPKSPFFQKLVDDMYGISKLNWNGVIRMLYHVDITAELKKIQQPILVCHGEFDDLLPKDRSIQLAKDLPNGKFYEIPGQGHCTNVENPEKFVSIVNEFLFSN